MSETTENTPKDKWELNLEKKLEELQACQVSYNFKSCYDCEKLLECTLRKEYVIAVYESMNKGAGGGFEF